MTDVVFLGKLVVLQPKQRPHLKKPFSFIQLFIVFLLPFSYLTVGAIFSPKFGALVNVIRGVVFIIGPTIRSFRRKCQWLLIICRILLAAEL